MNHTVETSVFSHISRYLLLLFHEGDCTAAGIQHSCFIIPCLECFILMDVAMHWNSRCLSIWVYSRSVAFVNVKASVFLLQPAEPCPNMAIDSRSPTRCTTTKAFSSQDQGVSTTHMSSKGSIQAGGRRERSAVPTAGPLSTTGWNASARDRYKKGKSSRRLHLRCLVMWPYRMQKKSIKTAIRRVSPTIPYA